MELTTDNIVKKVKKTMWDIALTTQWGDGEDIIDLDVTIGAAITGTCRMIKLRYNNTVAGTGVMVGIELVARAAANIATIQAIDINVLSKGKNISGVQRGVNIKMEEDTGGATIADMHGIHIEFALKSAPTKGAGILMETTDSYPPKYGIDFKGDYPLSPSMADIRLSGGPCIFTQAGVPTRTDLPEGSICLRTDPGASNQVLYVFYDTTWAALS